MVDGVGTNDVEAEPEDTMLHEDGPDPAPEPADIEEIDPQIVTRSGRISKPTTRWEESQKQ